jgi:plastocyanin
MRDRRPLLGVLLLSVACGGGGDERAAPAATPVTPLDRATLGTITGTVRFTGTPPTMASLPVDRWPGCAAPGGAPVLAGDALVRDGLVENAFVYVKDGLGERTFAVPAEPVVIDQRGCIYHPRVAGVRVGQTVKFTNSDALLHNVHGTPKVARGWNFSTAVKGSERSVQIDRAEVMVSVRCDLHPWMQMYLGALEHPYFAVTGADGRFALGDVPPGEYVIAAWHERFGTREERVTLAPRGSRDLTFTFATE